MKVVIVGDGKVGFALAEQLTMEEHDVSVIDKNQAVLDRLSETLDVLTICGNGASMRVQKEAGVPGSDILIAATSSDELNMLCCIVARRLGCKHTIARVRDPEYREQVYMMRDELGLSMMINPELSAARETFRLLQIPSFLKRSAFAKGRAEIVEIEVRAGNPLIGKKLPELSRVLHVRVLICAVERGQEVIIPNGLFRIEEGDKLYVTAPTQHLVSLVKALGIEKRKVRDIMLIGGSRIAYYLTQMLLESGIRVKVLEKSMERCRELAELLPKATIICGDGTDHQTLNEHGIANMDAVVTLTDIDEENLLVSMYANHLGVPTTITKLNRTEYRQIFRDKGIACTISPKLMCATSIVHYVRGMQNSSTGSAIAMHHLVQPHVEALEFRVTKSTRHTGETLAQIPLKPEVLIACISRQGKITIPQGSDTIEVGDSIVVVTPAERKLLDLNEIFMD